MATERLVLIRYDADCGICTWALGRIRRAVDARGIGVAALPTDRADDLAFTAVVTRGGLARTVLGGDAWLALLRALPGRFRIPAALAHCLPRALVRLLYDLVARHRHHISARLGLPGCATAQVPAVGHEAPQGPRVRS